MNDQQSTTCEDHQQTFIPRIKLKNYHLSCIECTLRLAFAMTINKSQGQSLGTVRLDLCNPVFEHGVCLELEQGQSAVKGGGKTENIVYKDMLLRPRQT